MTTLPDMSPAPARLIMAALLAVCVAWTARAAGAPAASPTPAAVASAAAPNNGFAEVLKPGRARKPSRPGALIQNQPYAPIQKPDDEGQIPEIEMFVGESRVFPAPGVARIAVGNGSLLTAAALDNKEVILFANGAGTSSLFIWNADGRYQRVKISIVPGDTARNAREIAAFLSTIPKAKASVVGANIIVEGDDLSDADIVKIEELAKRYSQIVNFTNRVGWEQMVMFDVKVVEFPVTVLRDIGLKWSSTGGAAIAGIWSPAQRGHGGPYEVQVRTGADNGVPITGPNGLPATIPSGLNAVAFMNMGLNAQLTLLAQEGRATLLAEPQLSARSGSKASFVAGGEIPYAVSTRDGVYVQFKAYGVKLDITPHVDHRGVVRATIQTEVSGIDRSVSTAGGPALLTRKTDTEFNLHNGETLVLSGLLQHEQGADVDKVPLLGDLPVIGALFRSKRFQNKQTELVVFVTPTLVNAQSPGMTERVRRTKERLEERLGAVPHLSGPPQPGVSYEHPDAVGAPEPAPASAPAAVAPLAAAVPVPIAVAAPPLARGLTAPSAAAAAVRGGSVLTVVAGGTALRNEPDVRSTMLLQLDAGSTVLLGPADPRPPATAAWRNGVVGGINGWVPAVAVAPRSRVASLSSGAVSGRRATTGRAAVRPTADTAPPRPLVLSGAPAEAARRYRVNLDGLPLRTLPDMNAEVLANLIAGDTVIALPQAPQGAWTAVQFGEGEQGKRGWVATQWLLPKSVQ